MTDKLPIVRRLRNVSEYGRIPEMKLAADLICELVAVLEPFAAVAEHDIGSDETNEDWFRPMPYTMARGPVLKVGDLRRARAALSKARGNEIPLRAKESS